MDSIYGLQGKYLFMFHIFINLYLHLNIYKNIDINTHTCLFMYENVRIFKYVHLYNPSYNDILEYKCIRYDL